MSPGDVDGKVVTSLVLFSPPRIGFPGVVVVMLEVTSVVVSLGILVDIGVVVVVFGRRVRFVGRAFRVAGDVDCRVVLLRGVVVGLVVLCGRDVHDGRVGGRFVVLTLTTAAEVVIGVL